MFSSFLPLLGFSQQKEQQEEEQEELEEEEEEEEEEQKSKKKKRKKRKEFPSILLITTHGEYEPKTKKKQEFREIRSGIDVRKINAVTFGTCNYLAPKTADDIADEIFASIDERRLKYDIDYNTYYLQQLLIDLDTERQEVIPNNARRDQQRLEQIRTTYIHQSDRAYNITRLDTGERIKEKIYTVLPSERVNSSTPFFDSMTLLTSNKPEIDLLQEITQTRATRSSTQQVKLSEILEYLSDLDINKLIIIDLSCSATSENVSARTIRLINKNMVNYGGYKRISKRNKRKLKRVTKRKQKSEKQRR